MTVITSSGLIDKIDIIRANPAAIQRLNLDVYDKTVNGLVYAIDPTIPFIWLMENSITHASAAMLRNETLARRQYASLSMTADDMYHHMSDVDYLDRFSTPAETNITMLLSYDEIIAKAVPVPGSNSTTPVSKLTIPRNTEITVAGIRFTLQYPIDIRVMPNRSLNIFYDITDLSPIRILESNQVPWSFLTVNNVRHVKLTFRVQQLAIQSQVAQLNSVTGFTKTYSFPNMFYYCRAFMRNSNDAQWTEVATTHTALVYDPLEVTVALRVLNQSLQVHVPQLYFNLGMVRDSLLILIYTCNGAQEVDLTGYKAQAFSARWIDQLQLGNNVYSAPLNTIASIGMYSPTSLSGGANALTLRELRDRITSRSLVTTTDPISQGQLENVVADAGYALVTNLDNVTDRQFLATRQLPAPTNNSTITPAGCAIHLFASTITDLASHATVIDNQARVTILPTTLFKSVHSIFEIVPDVQVQSWLSLARTQPEELASIINAGAYYYTPFHYVLDTSNDGFNIRPYRLDKPTVAAKYLLQENQSLLVDVDAKSYALGVNPDGSGYILAVEVAGSDAWTSKPVSRRHVQLSYLPAGSQNRIWLTGVRQPTTDREVYYFYISTRYDVDHDDRLVLMPYKTLVDLESDFDLVFIVSYSASGGAQPPASATLSDIDAIVNPQLLDGYDSTAFYYGVAQERYTLHFGDSLDYLWANSRSAIGSLEYQRYAHDIPATWTRTQYLTDSHGNIELTYNPGSGDYDFTILHNIGDPILISGVPQYKARAGDLVLDPSGQPIPVNGGRSMVHYMDMLFLDGRYYFATAEQTMSYRTEVIDLLTQWITTDLAVLNRRTLERTTIYFFPKTTIGKLQGYVFDHQSIPIDADQEFLVRIHLTKERYDNQEVRDRISQTVIGVLSRGLSKSTIAISDLIADMRDTLGSDIISNEISSNVFADSIYPVVTMRDQSMLPSIGKRLVALANQTLAVEDAVTVVFVKHTA